MKVKIAAVGILLTCVIAVSLFFGIRATFPRPYREIVKRSGAPDSLVYAVMRAESGFDEKAVSPKGAVGLMQLLPETAKFICAREGFPYEEEKLTDGEYNAKLGCAYLGYLLEKFSVREAIAAYNAGEGRVRAWLDDPAYSADGVTISVIPFPETERYVKKVMKFRKIYEFYY